MFESQMEQGKQTTGDEMSGPSGNRPTLQGHKGNPRGLETSYLDPIPAQEKDGAVQL